MDLLSSKDRLLKTLLGEQIDRIATFDIIHNINLIEYLTCEKVTPKNAEDLLCKATGEILDLIRHFSIPDKTDPWLVRDENGFVYRYEWWTAHLIERPNFSSTKEIENIIKRDIELIKSDTEKKKVCRIARQHVRLFDENYEYIEEVKEDYKRVIEKLDGPLMLPPEDVSPVGIATERYDEANWWYFYTDYPETARLYLDTLTDYQLCFIDTFACAEVCPFTQISVPIGTSNGLLYSPKFNHEEVLPREKKKIERWKKHGYYVMAFLDGYKWPLVDDYINAGACEIHPLEPYCQMDVTTFRQKYPEMAIGQPIDCTQLLPFGSPQEVREAVVTAIEDADRKKIIIGSTSEIHPEVKVENALTMYRTARNYKL